MICTAITADAFEAIVATLAPGSVGFDARVTANGERLIWIEQTCADKPSAIRKADESYGDVIIRLAANETGAALVPRDGSVVLSDLRAPYLSLACEPCGRQGRHAVPRLLEQHGDVRLTDLRLVLADCRKARSGGVHDGCRALYEGL